MPQGAESTLNFLVLNIQAYFSVWTWYVFPGIDNVRSSWPMSRGMVHLLLGKDIDVKTRSLGLLVINCGSLGKSTWLASSQACFQKILEAVGLLLQDGFKQKGWAKKPGLSSLFINWLSTKRPLASTHMCTYMNAHVYTLKHTTHIENKIVLSLV